MLKTRLSLVLVLILLAACGQKTTEETMIDYTTYLSELGLELSDWLQDGEGEVTQTPYAYLRFRVSGDVAQLQSALTEACGEELELTADEIPGYQGHTVAKKLAGEELAGVWNRFLPGQNGAKTRSIELYLTRDEAGEYFLYCFG